MSITWKPHLSTRDYFIGEAKILLRQAARARARGDRRHQLASQARSLDYLQRLLAHARYMHQLRSLTHA